MLTEVIAAQQVTAGTPHQGSPYLARLRAEAAEGHLVAAKLRLQQLQVLHARTSTRLYACMKWCMVQEM